MVGISRKCGHRPPYTPFPGRLDRHAEKTARLSRPHHNYRRPSVRNGRVLLKSGGSSENFQNFVKTDYVLIIMSLLSEMQFQFFVEI